MESVQALIDQISGIVWGPPLIVLLVGTGIMLTIRNRLIQVRGFRHSVDLIRGVHDRPEDEGHISHFEALSTALSATIGTGNIAGVATAIASGGPGAVFWMWVTAAFGMAVKFTSCTLSLKYRVKGEDGNLRGGPMYFIEQGMGQRWKPLAVFFAFATSVSAFGIGNMVQANSVADALGNLTETLLGDLGGKMVVFKVMIGLIIALLTGLVIVGGIKRIARVASHLVPFMTMIYIGGSLLILALNLERIIPVLKLIFVHAFTPTAAAGGFAGAVVMKTIRWGVARGVFSNESGLGTAPMAHAAARTEEPVREGLVAMMGPFVDTIIVCSMTAFVILISGLWTSGIDGAPLTSNAFEASLPGIGHIIVSIGLALFAYSTIISWYYYGEKGIEYLFGQRAITPYKWVYLILIPIGAATTLKVVWGFADIFNGLMALPNLIALIALSGVVAAGTKDYFRRQFGE